MEGGVRHEGLQGAVNGYKEVGRKGGRISGVFLPELNMSPQTMKQKICTR